MRAVVLPVLDANMTHAVVRAWLKREGDAVRAGEALLEVETDKVNAEVEAETAGVLRRIVAPEGTRVPILGIVAFIGDAEEAVPAEETWNELLPAASGKASAPADLFDGARRTPLAAPEPALGHPVSTVAQPAARVTASPAARRLARERGVHLDGVRGTGPLGEITRADVEAARAVSASGTGQLDAGFLDLLRRDPAGFRALSSEMKVDLYRRHGAQIGEGVRIEAGAILVARQIAIGAASTIGADCTIECERLQLGRLVALGKHTRVHCRSVEIGDALWSKDDVVIGGGGSDEAGARLRAGDACFFGEGAYLNTCHPLTLGDEVCIGSRAMLFTHSHWQSILRGYPALFGPVTVGDHVFIGNQAFVFPGVSIGAGATVMVNSFVALNVAPDTLVGGVPAQVLRRIVAPNRVEQVTVFREHAGELARVLRERGYAVIEHAAGDATIFEIDGNGVVCFTPEWSPSTTPASGRRQVVLSFVDDPHPAVAEATTLFDLAGSRVIGVQDRLSDEVREFCRRRGIRFRPLAWRYGVGHFSGDRFCPR